MIWTTSDDHDRNTGPRDRTPSDAHVELRTDLLADVLSHIRLTGAVFLRGATAAPWGLDSARQLALMELLSPDAERLLVFTWCARAA